MTLDVIHNKPCDQLVEIPDGSLDVIITSPPYNASQSKPQRHKKHNLCGYDGFSDQLAQDVYEIQQVAILNACARVLKPEGSIFYVHRPVMRDHTLISPYRWILRCVCPVYQEIVWHRKSTHRLEPSYLRPLHEYVFHLRRPAGTPRVNPSCSRWTSIWTIGWAETRTINHPAPFPRELVWRCLKLCDLPQGAVVLDPYMGSGTTAVVAVEEGYHFIGYEISAKYIRIAQNRIRLARIERQMELSCR